MRLEGAFFLRIPVPGEAPMTVNGKEIPSHGRPRREVVPVRHRRGVFIHIGLLVKGVVVLNGGAPMDEGGEMILRFVSESNGEERVIWTIRLRDPEKFPHNLPIKRCFHMTENKRLFHNVLP